MPTAELDTLKIESFLILVADGVEAWYRAGCVLAELVADDGEEVMAEIEAKCPGLSRATLDLFLSIGRREIYPMLAWSHSAGCSALAQLPYDEQERHFKEGVPVFTGEQCENIPVGALTQKQCHQVFDGSRIRTERQQRAWLLQAERFRPAESRPSNRIRITAPTSGWEPDAPLAKSSTGLSLDELKTATPLQLLQAALDTAHAAMMDARRHLEKLKAGAREDGLVSTALNSIGQLRFAANSGEIQRQTA